MRNPIARVGKSDPNSRSKVPLDHFSATVEVCTAPRSRNKPWLARGGCHERSPERPSIVLLLDRVGYRDCDRGRDTAHLSGSASQGLRQRWLRYRTAIALACARPRAPRPHQALFPTPIVCFQLESRKGGGESQLWIKH